MSPEQAEQWIRLREIGRRWPDPGEFVDPGWDDEVRAAVIRHLAIGTLVNQYRGLSRCRFCGCANGSAELTDGSYCWPEGLPHYVRAHAVRLPSEFVDHVMTSPRAGRGLPAPGFDDRLGQRDRTWPGAGLGQHLWAPAQSEDGYDLTVEVDATWWLEQG